LTSLLSKLIQSKSNTKIKEKKRLKLVVTKTKCKLQKEIVEIDLYNYVKAMWYYVDHRE